MREEVEMQNGKLIIYKEFKKNWNKQEENNNV